MNPVRPPLHRRVIPWVVGAAFVIVAGIAVWQLLGLRQEQRARERARIEALVVDQVAAWEDALVRDLGDALEIVAADPDRAPVRQRRLRRTRPWFNGLYLWTGERTFVRRGERVRLDPQFVFPLPAQGEDHRRLRRHPCVQQTKLLISAPIVDPRMLTEIYGRTCSTEDLDVRLHAGNDLANLFTDLGQSERALSILESVPLAEDLGLADAKRAGLALHRVVAHWLLRADNLVALGRTDDAAALLLHAGREIGELDGPDVAILPTYMPDIMRKLRRLKQPEAVRELENLAARAQRRLFGYREIAERILPRPRTGGASEAPRFSYDQYSEAPFLLFYGWSGDYGVALQLEQHVLIAEFLHSRMRKLRKRVTITDAQGNHVAGARRSDRDPIAITVPFARSLTHLRVGVRQSAIEAGVAQFEGQWILPLLIIGFCFVLGFTAMWWQVKATRQEYRLMTRQRDFTTRVTHELKTPLAGIRVMAENLEAGAFRDEQQLQEMAARIVQEADRLTERVDEVLAVARTRSVPNPEPFDPEEVLFEAIDTWGPRLEDAGVTLHADLAPTDQVLGDARAIRDAVACLLDNALKYKREDREDAQVWLTQRQEGGWVIIDVADNGIGVPPKQRKAIFDRFVRVEGPNRGKAGGHGLGLNQVAQIAKAHRGRISCVEGVNGGARFLLRLPALAPS